MRTFIWSALSATILMLCTENITAQDNAKIADQSKLMQSWIGTWQQKWGKDTVEVWKVKPYGKSFTMDVYLEIKGKKTHLRKNNFTFSADEGKFQGFQLYYDGTYDTWTGSFVSDKKFSLEITKNFKPGSTIYKYELYLDTPASLTVTSFENGLKLKEYRFKKEK
jgi:hypothetical protein